MRADLTFTARSPAIEEPHYWWRVGVRAIFDYTRFTQFGTWEGWIEIDGGRRDVSPATVWGSRDRSWGIRPTGESAPSGAPVGEAQFFWLWAPVNFPSLSTHFDVNEYGDGRRWHEVGVIARTDGSQPEHMRRVDYRIQCRPDTRWARRFETTSSTTDLNYGAGFPFEFDVRPHLRSSRVQSRRVEGRVRRGIERIALPVTTVQPPTHPRTGHLRRDVCRSDGTTEQGLGILEQLAIGNRQVFVGSSISSNTAIAFNSKPVAERRRDPETTCGS